MLLYLEWVIIKNHCRVKEFPGSAGIHSPCHIQTQDSSIAEFKKSLVFSWLKSLNVSSPWLAWAEMLKGGKKEERNEFSLVSGVCW